MIELARARIIPIGCSCISQFQIGKYYRDAPAPSGFFDWNIATPAASAAVMAAHLDGRLLPLLADRDAYCMLARPRYLHNRHFPGLYFWHEPSREILDPANPARFDAFQAKLAHLIGQTFALTPAPHLIWSNIQPNLRIVTARVSDDWGAFRLEPAGYARLKELGAAIFPGARFHFAVNRQDCAADLLALPDIHDLSLPRSARYVGPKGHYAPIFDAIAAD